MLITAILGLGCNILNFMTLQYCCNVKDEDGKKVDLNESIASSYKKYKFANHSFDQKFTKPKSQADTNGKPNKQDLESPL